MHIAQMPLIPPSPLRGEGDRLRRVDSLSLWERVGVRARGLLIRPVDVSTTVQAELVEALRQAQGERFKLHKAGSIEKPRQTQAWRGFLMGAG